MPEPQPSWDEVLASFEQDVHAAEQLLGGVDVPPRPILPIQPLNLPVLPARLRPRAAELQARQTRVTTQLSTAMAALRRQQQLAEADAAPRRPVYLDHRA